MDLKPQGILDTLLWKTLPDTVSVIYQGMPAPKLLKFEIGTLESPRKLWLRRWVSKEDAEVWKSCQEMLSFSVKNAAALVQGFFGFQLISMEIYHGAQHFVPEQFTQLLVNHAKKLEPGKEAYLRYGAFSGILKKRIPEAWGKIDFEAGVEIFNRDPKELDLEIKRMLREAGGETCANSIFVFHDLSTKPIFRFGQEEQTARLHKTLDRLIKEKGYFPDFYVIHGGTAAEIKAQCGIADT